jgi:glycosyltransferase involved in cell wall biosynthesis
MSSKKILIYSTKPNLHNLYDVMRDNPPNGYEIIKPKIERSKYYKTISNIKIAKSIYRILKRFFNNPIISEAVSTKYKIFPKDIDMIFSPAKIVLNPQKPYVIEIVDKITSLAGNDKKLFYKNKEFIKKALLQENCKKIICWTEACKKDFEKEFQSKEVNKKIEVVYLTKPLVPKKPIKKDYNKKQINLLFVGSINNLDDFLIKGGLETLETFKILSKKYKNLHLFIKCKLPKYIKKKYQYLPNLQIIEDTISEESLLSLYESADIFMTPAHNLNAFAPIEAMSYSLPLIGINTWAVDEIIQDNLNGFLVGKSVKIPYEKDKIHLDIRNKRFLRQIQKIDQDLISRIADKTELLINNPSIRKKLGEDGRKMVETGKFSFEKRNRKLKKIFDEILN